jgi:hypothetical protein
MKNPFEKKYHRAKRIRDDGAVSALCFVKDRRIDLSRAGWVMDDKRVTCPDCLKIIEARNVRERQQA